IERRKFLAPPAGAAPPCPFPDPPQPGGLGPIGGLPNPATNDPEGQAPHPPSLQGPQKPAWARGRNLRIEQRWTAGDADRGRKYAAELVALEPDVILTTGSAGLVPLLQVTRTIPIVFTIVPDPVGAGFVDSLARPGGNATGFSQF